MLGPNFWSCAILPGSGKVRRFLLQQKGNHPLKECAGEEPSLIALLEKCKHLSRFPVIERHLSTGKKGSFLRCGDIEGEEVKEALPPDRADISFPHPDIGPAVAVHVARYLCTGCKELAVGARHGGHTGLGKTGDGCRTSSPGLSSTGADTNGRRGFLKVSSSSRGVLPDATESNPGTGQERLFPPAWAYSAMAAGLHVRTDIGRSSSLQMAARRTSSVDWLTGIGCMLT